MSDDTNSHAELWEFDDAARIGDLVVQIVDRHYLASVAGDVAWKLFAANGSATESLDADTKRRIGYNAGRSIELAMLLIDQSGPVHISWTNHLIGPRHQIAGQVVPHTPGEYHFHLNYISGGRAVPFVDFRNWVQLSDDEEWARINALRARKYPQLYDENGDPRPRS